MSDGRRTVTGILKRRKDASLYIKKMLNSGISTKQNPLMIKCGRMFTVSLKDDDSCTERNAK